MKKKNRPPDAVHADPEPAVSKEDLDHISHNIESVVAFYMREERSLTRAQRLIEVISNALGQPLFLGAMAGFVTLWIVLTLALRRGGIAVFDPPPFFWLQGLVGLGAFMTMIIVLIRQNRMAKLEERRAHLEMQVNLLTEQKTTKLINLMEELRIDLPMIRNRVDLEATALRQPTDTESVLAALDERLI